MAVNKVLKTTSLSIEIESGQDKTGATVYKKKNFSGVKGSALAQNVYNVAEAIKLVLAADTRFSYLNDCSKLEEQA